MESTAIGDTINLASRLESETPELNEDILMSEDNCKAARGIFPGNLKKSAELPLKDAKMQLRQMP